MCKLQTKIPQIWGPPADSHCNNGFLVFRLNAIHCVSSYGSMLCPLFSAMMISPLFFTMFWQPQM